MKLSISKLQFIGGGASALVTLLALVVIWVMSASMIEKVNGQQRELFMGAIANQVITTIRSHAETIEALAKEPRVVEVFKGGSKAARTELENQLMSVFPQAWDVRLIDPGMDELDTTSSPHLGYADLAMIRESERNIEPPVAGAHAVGTDQAHIAMIHRVIGEDGTQVSGHLMVLFNMELITRMVEKLNLTKGFVQIRQQKQEGEALVLAQLGNHGLAEREPLIFPIEGSRWHLAYWTDPAVAGLPNSFLLGLSAVALLLLLLIGLIYFLISKTTMNKLQQDMATLITLSRDFSAGTLKKSYQAQLPDTEGSIKIIQDLLARASAGKKKPSTKPASDPADESSSIPDLDL